MYVWMDGWMCTSVDPERLDGFYSYSVFESLSIIGRCLLNMNILVPKIRALKMGLEKQDSDFFNNRIDPCTTFLICGLFNDAVNISDSVASNADHSGPRGLRHEPSSPARTLGSWVRIPLKAWMCVCVFILCLYCSVYR
jgi:hypothetical protein